MYIPNLKTFFLHALQLTGQNAQQDTNLHDEGHLIKRNVAMAPQMKSVAYFAQWVRPSEIRRLNGEDRDLDTNGDI